MNDLAGYSDLFNTHFLIDLAVSFGFSNGKRCEPLINLKSIGKFFFINESPASLPSRE
jgi:hypothetical protein